MNNEQKFIKLNNNFVHLKGIKVSYGLFNLFIKFYHGCGQCGHLVHMILLWAQYQGQTECRAVPFRNQHSRPKACVIRVGCAKPIYLLTQ